MTRAWNFCAGPAALPETVLARAAEDGDGDERRERPHVNVLRLRRRDERARRVVREGARLHEQLQNLVVLPQELFVRLQRL